ncbi:phage gp6-like head-tail connector protein [Staphylococcus xylosus]|uniref:phage gp6-like head-tail connector protein n=1 Tax=Staphylococcus xylosus TaxID=1288 RepID=UPI001C3EF280|nr:phage gp6-like head-tail connector protein [Staphylococcus xylosus]
MDGLLKEFKQRMHIFHDDENDSLIRILELSYEYIQELCGEFNIEKESIGVELVLERSRYVYNEQTEFFEENFSSLITSFGLKNIVYRSNDNEQL